MRALIADSDKDILGKLTDTLRSAGYAVLTASDARQCIEVCRSSTPDVVILASDLPVISGHTLCRQLREEYAGPIIMLSSCAQEAECVSAFMAGADDCVAKPIRERELLQRIISISRRYGTAFQQQDDAVQPVVLSLICKGDFVIDPNRNELRVRGNNVRLQNQQFKLLHFLASHAGTFYSKDYLVTKLWANETEMPVKSPKIVEVHVREIRKVIELEPSNPRHLLSAYMVGYKFVF